MSVEVVRQMSEADTLHPKLQTISYLLDRVGRDRYIEKTEIRVAA